MSNLGSSGNPSPLDRSSVLDTSPLFLLSLIFFSSSPFILLFLLLPFLLPSHPTGLSSSGGGRGLSSWLLAQRVVEMNLSLFLVQDWLAKHPHQTLPSLLTAPQVECLGGLPVFTGRWLGGLLEVQLPMLLF